MPAELHSMQAHRNAFGPVTMKKTLIHQASLNFAFSDNVFSELIKLLTTARNRVRVPDQYYFILNTSYHTITKLLLYFHLAI